MPQKLRNKKFGDYELGDISWMQGAYHISLCPNGAYCHVGGNPIENRGEFAKAGMKGEELEKALFWFDNRHKMEENPVREIMLLPDGTPVFVDDRTPVESPTDLINYYGAGPAFDTAMYGLARRRTVEKNEAKMAAAREARTGKKTPPPKKATNKRPVQKPVTVNQVTAPPTAEVVTNG